MSHALSLSAVETPLTERAAEFLAAGPADAPSLISYVCQLPGAPPKVAEHMATALFAGHKRFTRCPDGRWSLAGTGTVLEPGAALLPGTGIPTAIQDASFFVVDVETTGTSARRSDRITEIAAVLVRNGTATVVFDSLINPERPIPSYITSLTQITSDMVARAPRFAEVCSQLLGVLEGHVFTAHNAAFDWGFVSMEVERATRRQLTGRRLCTVRLARRLVPHLRRRNLDSVAHYFGVEVAARHRAGGDALATAQVLIRLLDAAADSGCETLDDLDALVARGQSRRRGRRPPASPQPVIEDTTA
jgi:DNA polymerase-3 subunit epsilon